MMKSSQHSDDAEESVYEREDIFIYLFILYSMHAAI